VLEAEMLKPYLLVANDSRVDGVLRLEAD